MKKIVNYICAAAVSTLLTVTSVTAFAEEEEYNTLAKVVIAVNEGGYCLLSDGSALKQGDFRHYSGEDFDLQPGDVVDISTRDSEGVMVLEMAPCKYCFNENYEIRYLGKAEEYHAEYVKELTVTNANPWQLTMTDENGISYLSEGSYAWNWAESGEAYGLTPADCSVGDTIRCVTEHRNATSYCAVILEKTSEAEYAPGDATGEGDVNLMDVISINRHIMIGEHLAPAGKKAADLNGDGKVTPAESLQILRYVVKLEDTLQ